MTLDDAFKLLPDGVHIGIYYDFISKEWYVDIDQSPLKKLTYYDITGLKSLPEIISDACKAWENG